jgi:hypothetical protein
MALVQKRVHLRTLVLTVLNHGNINYENKSLIIQMKVNKHMRINCVA